jgi:hypothetical protein
MTRIVTSVLAAALAASAGPALAAPTNVPDARGVIREFDFSKADDLLELGPSVRMIMFRGAEEAALSSAHSEMLKRWIAAGGIAYLYQGAWNSSLARKLGLVEASLITVTKENGVSVEGTVGELVVREMFPYLQIRYHKITDGVRKLYLCNATTEFRPVGGARIVPILQVGYNAEYGAPVFINPAENVGLPAATRAKSGLTHLATVYAVVEMGSGLIIYDGTSMVDGPNAFSGNAYDWPRMFENVLNFAGTH